MTCFHFLIKVCFKDIGTNDVATVGLRGNLCSLWFTKLTFLIYLFFWPHIN